MNGVECFLGTFEDALARAEALGVTGIVGPYSSSDQCLSECFSDTGTTTTPLPGCGHCAAGQMQQTYYTQFPGLANLTCGKCDQIAAAAVALTLHGAAGNCRYRTVSDVFSCGPSGSAYLEMRFVGTEWFILIVYPALGSEEALYRCADGNFNCTGASTFEYIGGSSACDNFPATIQVWTG